MPAPSKSAYMNRQSSRPMMNRRTSQMIRRSMANRSLAGLSRRGGGGGAPFRMRGTQPLQRLARHARFRRRRRDVDHLLPHFGGALQILLAEGADDADV